jgi:hypothetical protein
VRVPKAGGTLYNLTKPASWSSSQFSEGEKDKVLAGMADSSLLLLADIVPTGVFGALQVLNHPKVLPVTTGRPWPHSYGTLETSTTTLDKDATLLPADRILTFAVLGLGPVGVVGVFCCSFLFTGRYI